MAKIEQNQDDKTVQVRNTKVAGELSEDELGQVVGGLGTAQIVFDDATTTPRDPASGLATGKRMHKPYNIDG